MTPPRCGGTGTLPGGPLPFLRGLLYHRSFLMSGIVIRAVGHSVRILCSKAGGDMVGNGDHWCGTGGCWGPVAYLRVLNRSSSKVGGKFSSPSSHCTPGSYRWAGPRATLPEGKTCCLSAPGWEGGNNGNGNGNGKEAAQQGLHRELLQGGVIKTGSA